MTTFLVTGANGKLGRHVTQLLLDELEKESPTKCSVVVFRSYLGLSTRETAEKLDLTEAVVEHEWHRARRWLYQRLSEA